MEAESFFAKAVHAVVFVIVCLVIISVGWNEPLRYRFMSAKEIEDLERPLRATPVVAAPTPFPIESTRLGEPGRSKTGQGGMVSPHH